MENQLYDLLWRNFKNFLWRKVTPSCSIKIISRGTRIEGINNVVAETYWHQSSPFDWFTCEKENLFLGLINLSTLQLLYQVSRKMRKLSYNGVQH